MSKNVCFIDKNGDIGTCLRDNPTLCKVCLSGGVHNRFLVEIEKSMPRSRSDPIWFRKGEVFMEAMTELQDRCNHEFDHIELISASVNQTRGGARAAIATFVCKKCKKELKKISDLF